MGNVQQCFAGPKVKKAALVSAVSFINHPVFSGGESSESRKKFDHFYVTHGGGWCGVCI